MLLNGVDVPWVWLFWSECGPAGCLLSGLAVPGVLAVWPVPAVVAAAWVFRVPGSPGVPGVPAVPGCGGRAVAAAGREPPQCGIDTVRTVALWRCDGYGPGSGAGPGWRAGRPGPLFPAGTGCTRPAPGRACSGSAHSQGAVPTSHCAGPHRATVGPGSPGARPMWRLSRLMETPVSAISCAKS